MYRARIELGFYGRSLNIIVDVILYFKVILSDLEWRIEMRARELLR